ncbi:hypothetical protein [Limobrevibacterium gyesilva]|uniref:Uncharacterized protein n=1 Tax=Limobrevibacterium gyesilva TaxID=2991712 RepID=A0AA41YQF4_9PROT|nr:hypothetical protein [Limobrevibacterium gyesilva]MCW3477789.1 hypothetical protein [Limobrevibacterium gyesilva]
MDDLLNESTPARPLRPSSIAAKRYQIRQFASALVLTGVPIEEIDALAVLVTAENFKLGLRFLLDRERRDKSNTRTAGQVAHTIRSIARYHLRFSEAELSPLNNITTRLNRHEPGMTEKNRHRVAQFSD